MSDAVHKEIGSEVGLGRVMFNGSIMKLPADSVIFALVNLALVCLSLLAKWTHVGCCSLGGPANIIGTIVVPTELVLSLFFIVRDVRRPTTRRQALIAVILLIPGLCLLLAPKVP